MRRFHPRNYTIKEASCTGVPGFSAQSSDVMKDFTPELIPFGGEMRSGDR